MKEDAAEGINAAIPLQEHHHKKPPTAEEKRRDEDEDDPLKEMLKGFFDVFEDFEREFSGDARKKLVPGNHEFEQIKALQAKMMQENPPSEEELQVELDKIDLKNVGAPLGAGRVLALIDLVEELSMIGTIPHKKIHKLEKQWHSGKMESVAVFEQIQEMHEQHLVPTGWLQLGVDEAEQEEEVEETSDEAAAAKIEAE